MSSKTVHAVPPERIRAMASDKFGEEIEDGTCVILSELLDDMLESLVDWSIKVAASKGSSTLDPEDVRFIAEQEWGINYSESTRANSNK